MGRLRPVTAVAYEVGAACGSNSPGTQGVGALLDFVADGDGRAAWERWLERARVAPRAAA